MTRTLVVVAATLCAVALGGTACSGSSGTHTESLSPIPSESSSPSDMPSSSPRASLSATTAPATNFNVRTPTVTPPAQGAVDAYITLLNLYNGATRDPGRASVGTINKYLDGKALAVFDHSLSAMIKSGYAYRGTPDSPRLKVASVLSPTAVFLSSCPLASRTDPFVEYDSKTGKALPVPTRSPPPPYLLTITMKRVRGQWKVTDLLQNTSKTCHG